MNRFVTFLYNWITQSLNLQKQPSRGVLIKLLCNFIEIALRHGCSRVNLLHIFRTPFSKNTSRWLLLNLSIKGTVMQTEKALINDRLRIPKVPCKLHILNLLFFKKVAYFLLSFLFINKTLRLNNLNTRTAMYAKISVFAICVEAIMYLLSYNLHHCTFKVFFSFAFICVFSICCRRIHIFMFFFASILPSSPPCTKYPRVEPLKAKLECKLIRIISFS